MFSKLVPQHRVLHAITIAVRFQVLPQAAATAANTLMLACRCRYCPGVAGCGVIGACRDVGGHEIWAVRAGACEEAQCCDT